MAPSSVDDCTGLSKVCTSVSGTAIVSRARTMQSQGGKAGESESERTFVQ